MPEAQRIVAPYDTLMMKFGNGNQGIMPVLMLLLGVLLWLAAAASCNGDAAIEPASRNTPLPPVPVSPTGTKPATAASSPTPQPTARASATPGPTSSGAASRQPADSFPTPPERDYYQLARELMPGVGEVDPVARHTAPTLEAGHRETFRLVDLQATEQYESDFVLRLVTPGAYWFVEDGVEVEQEALERSAYDFENTIYPRVTGVFGKEWTPGVDGDPRLYVINANLRGVGGYFNSADEYPSAIRPVSNEIEAIYINVRYLPPGSEIYLQVLAHELQHAVHWKADVSEETWVNEGLSELAVVIAGFAEPSILEFRRAGPTSLIHWPSRRFGGRRKLRLRIPVHAILYRTLRRARRPASSAGGTGRRHRGHRRLPGSRRIQSPVC